LYESIALGDGFLRTLAWALFINNQGFWAFGIVEWNIDKDNIKCYNPQNFFINLFYASLRLIKKTIGLVFYFLTLEFM
jgi:hypothetical protein